MRVEIDPEILVLISYTKIRLKGRTNTAFHQISPQTVRSTMKTLLLLALAGFVLAVGLAVPFIEDDLEPQENELKDIAEDYGEEDPDER